MTRLAFVGDTSRSTAVSRVNRVWLPRLAQAGYELVGDDGADVLIHHDYHQHFATCPAGRADRRVAVRTWDFGPFPRTWTGRIGHDFDRLWVHTEWIREKAIEGGVDPDRVSVVPHGFDPSVFSACGPAADLGPRFTFLFVGATVARKGVDVLLRAYADAFSPDEPVCLILKGHSGDMSYDGQPMAEEIDRFGRDPGKPALRHLDSYLSDEELAALYRAADTGVFPYRAEGFAMPILEAMACGLPCIVPRFGACLDYCTDDNAFLVDARRIRFRVGRDVAFNALGFREQVEHVDFCEVRVADLAAALRRAYDASDAERRARGAAAARTAHERWTWDRAMARVLQLLAELQPRS